MESNWRRWSWWRWLRGQFPVPAGCRNRDFCPPKLVLNSGGARSRILRNLSGLGFSPWGQFMVQRAASGGARGGHTTPRRGLGFPWLSRLVGPAQAASELRFEQIRCLFHSAWNSLQLCGLRLFHLTSCSGRNGSIFENSFQTDFRKVSIRLQQGFLCPILIIPTH